ncbi:MAG: type I-E CRISPR-associated protein Cas6/Cse3/CasE [Chloroflexi bacterium]|nr:type I-E CRISPR-associated protein Cas6/Cse3/CasE [Chloroflexota bacterium]
MYISYLLINVGSNPDRPRPGRLWLRNLYHVHQRLCMAFPSASRVAADKDFLQPFKPEDFGAKQVHIERGSDNGFLFRIDPVPGGSPVILVQSAIKPDWDYAFQNAGYLLACDPQVKAFDPAFAAGQALRFRLAANSACKTGAEVGGDGNKPSVERHRRSYSECRAAIKQLELKLSNRERDLTANMLLAAPDLDHATVLVAVEQARAVRKDEIANNNKQKHGGQRVPVQNDKLEDWLIRKGKRHGFRVEGHPIIQPGYMFWRKPEPEKAKKTEAKEDTGRRRLVRYKGVLTVTDAGLFRRAIISGIGPGKAFGFGLLSVAPLRGEMCEAGGKT